MICFYVYYIHNCYLLNLESYSTLQEYLRNYHLRSFTKRMFKEFFVSYNHEFPGVFGNENQALQYALSECILEPTFYTTETNVEIPLSVVPQQDLYTQVMGIKRNSYVAFQSAMYVLRLCNVIPNKVYVNYEHAGSYLPKNKQIVTQDSIHVAFANQQRKNILEYTCGGYSMMLTNGKFTERLGVELVRSETQCFYYTNLERTLIDIAVRPAYSGGVGEVLQAYVQAKCRVNVQKLWEYLQALDFTYPYHQVIGFYLEKAGYSESEYSLFYKEIMYDFYITYNIKNKVFNDKWRLWTPKQLTMDS